MRRAVMCVKFRKQGLVRQIMDIRFHGGTGTVTDSKYLVRNNELP
jgi:hypothetical protein